MQFGFIALAVGFITDFVSFIVKFFTTKLAVRTTIAGAMVALTVAFTLAIDNLISSIVYATPTGMYTVGFSLLPGNTNACLAAFITAYVTRWVYDYHAGFISRWTGQGM